MIELQKPEKLPRAVLVGINTSSSAQRYERSMHELSELAKACGIEPAASIVQNTPDVTRATLIGSGKVHEVLLTIEECGADLVIFNEALTPMQVRNLEKAFDTEVLDKTGIILQIFASRARTREARLQVESARLQYMLPRLVGMRRNLSRQGGGSGRLSNKGAGEEKLELDRRHIEHQLEVVNARLKEVRRERQTQRSSRTASGLPLVSLVGYTNAGKSTLMNALLDKTEQGAADKKVPAQDMLFATLDTSVRRIRIPGHHPFLLSDTVGFISDLPHPLVKAFRSTLEEVRYSDLLLEVVDCSDEDYEQQIRVTGKTLEDIGADGIPILYVYNKADLREDVRIPVSHADHIWMSAGKGVGIDLLLERIDQILQQRYVEKTLLIPYPEGSVLHDLKEAYPDAAEEYLPEGIQVRLRMSRKDAARLARFSF